MSEEKVRELADGRIYSTLQAKENGLIDEVEGYEDALRRMEEKTGYEGFEPVFATSYSIIDLVLGKVDAVMPKSDLQVLRDMASDELNGVPLYMYVRQ